MSVVLQFRTVLISMALFAASPACILADNQTVASDGSEGSKDDTAPIHRIVLLVQPFGKTPDPTVEQIHAKYLAARDSHKHKFSLPRLATPGAPAPSPGFAQPGKPVKRTVAESTSLTEDQLSRLASLYMLDAFQDRIKSRLGVSIAPVAQVVSALNDLKLSSEGADTSAGAQLLCSKLDCDAVVTIKRPSIVIRETQVRELSVRFDVHLAALRNPHGGFMVLHRSTVKTGRPDLKRVRPPGTFTVAGAATSARAFLRAGYATDVTELAHEAINDCAALALHTLTTGEISPMMPADTRIAIAPVVGRDHADALIFDRDGHHTEPAAVAMIGLSISDYFRPDLLPVLRNETVDAVTCDAALKRLKRSANSLWVDDHTPDVSAVRKLGLLVNAQYVFVARISDLQYSTNATGPGGEFHVQEPQPRSTNSSWEREAHAEAVGAIIRTEDGAIIWSDRGDTTVVSREVVPERERAVANRRVCLQAEKFALVDLKRKFSQFKLQYQQ